MRQKDRQRNRGFRKEEYADVPISMRRSILYYQSGAQFFSAGDHDLPRIFSDPSSLLSTSVTRPTFSHSVSHSNICSCITPSYIQPTLLVSPTSVPCITRPTFSHSVRLLQQSVSCITRPTFSPLC